MGEQQETLQEYIKRLQDNLNFSPEVFTKALENIRVYSTRIDTLFGSTRARFVEINQAVADAIPVVERLGGTEEDALKTLTDIASATRKNVLASSEEVSKIYAVSKVMGEEINRIVDQFTNVGVNFTKVGGQLEESINYVNSLGLNTRAVMGMVVDNADKLSRFNFEGGVKGMTKMAAQASMLRVDMASALSFAEKVMDPDKAIEVASGFQRMGVAVGNLVDPFQLMNMSINDPGGLQTSLANALKTFSYFDEKSKTFKMNPAAALKMKELSDITGYGVDELRKMSLAAREVDEIMSQISPTIDIAEEDKMYLANIAKMGEDGEYYVKTDEGTKKLSEIGNDKLEELIQQQRDAPKTAEDMARNQLGLSELIQADVKSIRDAVVGGMVTQTTIARETEGLYRALTTSLGSLSGEFADAKTYRDAVSGNMSALGDFVQNIKKGENAQDAFQQLFKDLNIKNKEVQDKLLEKLGNFVSKTGEKLDEKTLATRLVKQAAVSSKPVVVQMRQDKATPQKTSVTAGVNQTQSYRTAQSTQPITQNTSLPAAMAGVNPVTQQPAGLTAADITSIVSSIVQQTQTSIAQQTKSFVPTQTATFTTNADNATIVSPKVNINIPNQGVTTVNNNQTTNATTVSNNQVTSPTNNYARYSSMNQPNYLFQTPPSTTSSDNQPMIPNSMYNTDLTNIFRRVSNTNMTNFSNVNQQGNMTTNNIGTGGITTIAQIENLIAKTEKTSIITTAPEIKEVGKAQTQSIIGPPIQGTTPSMGGGPQTTTDRAIEIANNEKSQERISTTKIYYNMSPDDVQASEMNSVPPGFDEPGKKGKQDVGQTSPNTTQPSQTINDFTNSISNLIYQTASKNEISNTTVAKIQTLISQTETATLVSPKIELKPSESSVTPIGFPAQPKVVEQPIQGSNSAMNPVAESIRTQTSVFSERSSEKEKLTTTSESNVNVNGTVTFNVTAPNTITQQQLTNYVDSEEFKSYVKEIVDKHFKEMGRVKKGF